MAIEPIIVGPGHGDDVGKHYGIPGLIDIRADLPWYRNGGPDWHEFIGNKLRVVVHYNGPPMNLARSDLQLAQDVAGFHIQRDWSDSGAGVRGNGIMYHLVFGRSGQIMLSRTLERFAWHSGNGHHNRYALACFLPLGGDQVPTDEQWGAVVRFLNLWRRRHGISRDNVVGHSDLQRTSCPGDAVRDRLNTWRNGGDESMARARYFSETGHSLGGAFLQHWEQNGGLLIFGYPLSDEFDIQDVTGDEGRRTIQVFERAVLEWYPENEPGFRVLGRRLGADRLQEFLDRAV